MLCWSLSRVWLLVTPWVVGVTDFSVQADSPGENPGVGFQTLLQGIFPTQGSNPGLPHSRQILFCLSHQGSPVHGMQNSKILALYWGAYGKMFWELLCVCMCVCPCWRWFMKEIFHTVCLLKTQNSLFLSFLLAKQTSFSPRPSPL